MEYSHPSTTKLPYIPEIDTEILDYLSDQDLLSMCQTDKYYRDLCQDDGFWRHRIRQRIGRRFTEEKPQHLTWRQWYFFWSKHPYDKISQALNLKPINAYYRIISETGITKESRYFQNINITLGKALAKKDDDLVNFYWQELLQIVETYKKNRILPGEIINYPRIIELAITNGYANLVPALIDVYYKNLSMFVDQDVDVQIMDEYGYNIIEILARYRLDDLVDRFNQSVDDAFKNFYYLTGLIKAHRNKEALDFMYKKMQLGELDYREYYRLLIDAYLSGNKDIIPELKAAAKEGTHPYYFEKLYQHFLIATGEKEAVVKDEIIGDEDEVLQALIDIQSPKVYDYYLKFKDFFDEVFRLYNGTLYCPSDMKNDAIMEFIAYHISKFSMKDCSASYIAALFDLSNKREILSQIVKYGRYDVLHLLSDEISELRSDDLESAIDTAVELGYIDIYIYLLKFFIKANDDKAGDDYFTLDTKGKGIPNDGLFGALEAYVIAHELAPLIDELDDIEYMPLLIYANKYVIGEIQLK